MGCGASRSPQCTLSFIPRVEKERDDSSLELIQLKRLGQSGYDDFFTEFEAAVNVVVNLNNKLHDALWDAKAALAYASSPDPEYALDLEIATDGIRSAPQLLLDVSYADSNNRPLPFEARHLLTSRPAIAEADKAVADAVHALTAALQAHPAPAQLIYDDTKLHLTVVPIMSGPPIPGAAQQYQRLHQHAARVSSALGAMRSAAPGLRLLVTVVPSPAPGARTFAWRLLARPDVPEGDAATGAMGTKGGGGAMAAADARRVASPLRVASAHGAAEIMDAAAKVAQQVAAIAAAVTNLAAPLVQLQLDADRRLVAVIPPESFVLAAAAASTQRPSKGGGVVILRTLSLTRRDSSGGAAAAAGGGGGGVDGDIAAASRVDEAAAVLRRAVSSANHALFRLAKYATAGASSGRDAAALRKGDPAAYPLSRAMALVLEEAIRAARQAAGPPMAAAAAKLPGSPLPSAAVAGLPGGSDGGGDGGGSVSVSELVTVAPLLQTSSEAESGSSSALSTGGGGGAAAWGGSLPDGLFSSSGWHWEWGIHLHVPGMSFPDCLPPKARAVYDAVNMAVAVARAVTEQLPQLQRGLEARVGKAEGVFRRNDDRLAAASRDMMSAGRMRATLDRNANTISASPALLGLLQASVTRLTEELRRGAIQMRRMAAAQHTNPDAADASADGDGREFSPRPSGSRSTMARQLNKAAAVAAAAVAAAAAAAATEDEEYELEDEVETHGWLEAASGLDSRLTDSGGGGSTGTRAGNSNYGADRGRGCGGGSSGGGGSGAGVVQFSDYGMAGADGRPGASVGGVGRGGVGGGGGGLKSSLGTSLLRGNPVSRRVMLPPLPPGS